MKTKILLKTVLFVAVLLTFTLSADNEFNNNSAFFVSINQVFATTSCHDTIWTDDYYIEPSSCQLACGFEGYTACTYMDCGNGTELCTKLP